jgi:hypothetical protein
VVFNSTQTVIVQTSDSVESFGNGTLQAVYVCIQNCILSGGSDPSENPNFVLIYSAISNINDS